MVVLRGLHSLGNNSQLGFMATDRRYDAGGSGTITLDGKLDESGWAKAESKVLVFGKDNGIPGSGWKIEGGFLPTDSTKATIKLLTYENQLYLGAVIPDKSIGGSPDFNRFDGLLMAIKDHANGMFPKPPAEYLYSWWFPDSLTLTPGVLPDFRGSWGIDEFGVRDSRLVWIDEALTPDSSRFWPAPSWREGGSPPSYDKQFVRDWLETTGWDKAPPAPVLPAEVVAGTLARYVEAFRVLTGAEPLLPA